MKGNPTQQAKTCCLLAFLCVVSSFGFGDSLWDLEFSFGLILTDLNFISWLRNLTHDVTLNPFDSV